GGAGADSFAAAVAGASRDEEGDDHDGDAHQDPRHVAGHEQGRDAHPARDGGVDDRGGGGRDQQADGGGGDVDGGGVGRVVAGGALALVERAADRRGRGDRGAGQRAEEHVRQHVGVGEGAGDAP